MLETIRVTQKGKDQLLKLKRFTRIPTWNVLCRWGFCVSLAEPTPVSGIRTAADGPIEMTWKTFAGQHEELYLAILKERCREDGLELTPQVLTKQFRLHLHRGLSYLAGDRSIRSITDLVRIATNRDGE